MRPEATKWRSYILESLRKRDMSTFWRMSPKVICQIPNTAAARVETTHDGLSVETRRGYYTPDASDR
jgi:hypothetical protein